MKRKLMLGFAGVFVLVLAWLVFAPVSVEPVAWTAPKAEGYVGAFAPNERLAAVEKLPLEGDHGPEDVAVAPDGRVVTTSHGGGLFRVEGAKLVKWTDTGGRPLGLEFDGAGTLWVADAHRGLLKVDAEGKVEVALAEVAGVPLRYADDVDTTPDGAVYFSDASTKFGAEAIGDTMEAAKQEMIEHAGTGRMIEYLPSTGAAKVIADGLVFPNGVAASADGASVFFNETGSYRVLRYHRRGPKAGQVETVIENLPGFPDNLTRGADGRIWVGLISPRNGLVDALSGVPFARKMIMRLPAFMRPDAERYGHVFAFDAQTGEVLTSLQDPTGGYAFATGAHEAGEWLYVSSLKEPTLARIPLADALR